VLADAMVYLSRQKIKWDFIFADPPYDFNNYKELIFKSIEKLENNGIFILEHGGSNNFQEHENLKSTRKYGSVRISVFQKSSISSNS
jgi:16S rRNA G966 N2-methylase RsmD